MSDLPALEAENAALRAQYLAAVPTIGVAELGPDASMWKDDGRVFAILDAGSDRFPAFQFADQRPRAAIRAILTALPADMTSWQITLWLASGNGWLAGAAPQDRLDNPSAVVAAAARLLKPAVG